MHPSTIPFSERERIEREYEIEVALQRIRCANKFSDFIKCAWEELEPETPLAWNWHLDYLCDEAQEQIERIAHHRPRQYHLIINVPPRSLKSWIFTRAPAAWAWIKHPWIRFMTVSYAEELALEHAVDTRTLILSDWYQERWGDKYQLAGDQNIKSFYKTTAKGYRMTGSVGGKAIGRGGHIITIDDPLSPEEAEYDNARETVIRWWSRTIRSRLNNPTVGMFWIVVQRLHENDLTGYLVREEGEKFKHICLPAEEGDQIRPVELRKKYINGLLFEKQFPKDLLEAYRRPDPYMYAGQYLQIPSPPEGGMFKRQWWRFWKPAGMSLPAVVVQIGPETHTCPVYDLPESFDETINSWDMGLKESKKNDPLAGTVWSQKGPDFFLLDLVHDRLDPLKAAGEAKALYMRYPSTSAVLIEDTAGGSSAIVDLRRTIPGVQAIVPKGDKKTRAIPTARLLQAGNLYLPHPAICNWVNDFIEEFSVFPNGTHDDRIDSTSQAMNYLLAHRRVWPDYKGEAKTFKIDFNDLNDSSVLIIAQYMESDLTSSCIMALWSKRSGSFYVFDECVSETPRPEVVVPAVLSRVRNDSNGLVNNVETLKRFKWYGNPLMSNKGGAMGDMVDAYRKQKVNVNAFQNQDELGSVIRVSLLLSRRALSIHTRCAQLRQQMQEWGMENKKPAQGHGLCRALALAVTVLWDNGTLRKREVPLKPYSARKTKFKNENDIAMAQGRIAEKVVGKKDSKPHDPGWVV
jgi:predicted phage terminase large subunit-like protein